jgi:hypothetical protein
VTGARRIFSASGLPSKPIREVKWVNITAEGREAGSIEYAYDWIMTNVTLRTSDGRPLNLSNCEKVETPGVIKE